MVKKVHTSGHADSRKLGKWLKHEHQQDIEIHTAGKYMYLFTRGGEEYKIPMKHVTYKKHKPGSVGLFDRR